jgi:putative ABC transport system permease protein
MWNLTLRNLAARKRRVALTAVAIVLGISFITATRILGDTANHSLTDAAGAFYDTTAVDVRGADLGTGRRGPVPTALGAEVAKVDGVTSAVDLYLESVTVVRDTGKVLPQPVVAGVWFDEHQPLRIVEGKAPTTAGEAVLTTSLADDTGFGVGDTVRYESVVGPSEAKVTGIVEAESSSVAGVASMSLGSGGGERLLPPGQTTEIVAFGKDVSIDAVKTLAAKAGKDLDVRTGAATATDAVDAARSSARALTITFGVFGGLALFVGAFIIYNTFNILMTQRKQEMALLRAIGVRRRQVTNSALAEAAAIGLLAGIVGALLGVVIAIAGRSLLLSDIDGALVVGPAAIVTGIVLGLVIAVGSAIVPIRKASSVPPVAALRDAAAPSGGINVARTIVGGLLAAVSIALLVTALGADADQPAVLVGVSASIGLLALLVLAPTLAFLLVPVIGAPVRLVRGQVGALATQNARRQPQRTASTASALMIGVAIVALALVVASSLRATVTSAVKDRVNATYVVAPVVMGSPLSPAALDAARTAAAPAEVSATSTLQADVNGAKSTVFAIDTGTDLWDLRPQEGTLADLGPDTVLVDQHVADDKHLALGDPVEIDVAGGGTRTLKVGVIGETRALGADYVIDATDLAELDPNATVDQLLIGKGADRARIEKALAGFPNAEVTTPESMAKALSSIVDLLLSVLLGFLGLSVVIAFMGVANTMALSIHERTRELGILRAIALRRSHIRSAVRWEAAIISVLGTVLGIVFGAGFGIALTKVLESTGFVRLDVPWGQLGLVVVLAALAGTMAAALPARRAAKLDILDAIHEL